MNAHTDTHAATTPGIWQPPASPAPDVVDAATDWGTMNRELLAEKLRRVYWSDGTYDLLAMTGPELEAWIAVTDVALAELQDGMDRETLANLLPVTLWGDAPKITDDEHADWLRVVDVAIAELQGTPDA